MKRIEYVKQTYKGINFDSLTELNFYQQYEHKVVRCEQTIKVWESFDGLDWFDYTPDFYDESTNTYIEIKGTHKQQYWNEGFVAKLPIIKAYFREKNVNFVILVPSPSGFTTVECAKVAFTDKRLEAQKEVAVIWNLLYERKALKQDEKSRLVDLLVSREAKWVVMRKGIMKDKAKKLVEIRAKLLPAKDRLAVLEKHITSR